MHELDTPRAKTPKTIAQNLAQIVDGFIQPHCSDSLPHLFPGQVREVWLRPWMHLQPVMAEGTIVDLYTQRKRDDQRIGGRNARNYTTKKRVRNQTKAGLAASRERGAARRAAARAVQDATQAALAAPAVVPQWCSRWCSSTAPDPVPNPCTLPPPLRMRELLYEKHAAQSASLDERIAKVAAREAAVVAAERKQAAVVAAERKRTSPSVPGGRKEVGGGGEAAWGKPPSSSILTS